LTINITDASSDSDGTISSRSWSFGDGSVSTAANPNHTYATGGSYKVRLTVTDNDGASNTLNKSIVVINPAQNRGILYIYCHLYGCDTVDQTVTMVPDPGTQSVGDTVNPSFSASAEDKGSSLPGSTINTITVLDDSVDSFTDIQSETVVTAPQPPTAPSNLTASVLTSGRGKTKTKTATLNWTDNSSNEFEFVIERCEQTGKGKNKTCNFVEWDIVPADTTVYKDVPVTGTYKYRVKARNSTDDSANSKEVKI
jgi:PKD repeat protein